MWSSVRQWFLGSSSSKDIHTDQPVKKNDVTPNLETVHEKKDLSENKTVNGTTPAKKSRALILVAPPNELQPVW